MDETVAAQRPVAKADAPTDAARALAVAGRVRARSQIVWGEHCTECAYPACYSTCSFYEPRPDLNCRRFVAGIERVRGQPALRRIRFRRWGKLEGQGPAPLFDARTAARRERLDGFVSGALAAAPLPFAARRNAAWRWNGRKARASAKAAAAPDAFVVEGWSGDGRPHAFTLTFLQDQPQAAIFQAHFTLEPDYGRLAVPVGEIRARIDLAQPYRVQIEPVGEAEGVDVVLGLTDFVVLDTAADAPAAAPPRHPLAKVLVWDLDETLWTGTLAEDGAAGVHPRPEAVAAIKALDARGVLQSIASKNDAAEAIAALRRFGLDDYFLHPQVGWGPKSQSVAAIASALDLGLDSFVFVDDQPFERAEVQAAHPTVRALPHTAVEGLATHAWFDHPATPEAAGRRRLYQSEARRQAAFQGAPTDYLAFLRSSALVLDIAPLTAADALRAHELSQRTNQLNFTGAKFSQAEVAAMLAADPDRERWVLRCTDRFGDYGLIGFADLDLSAGELCAFFMSCRVQRKRVEHAVFAHAARRLAARGHGEMRVRFRATERNGAALQMLTELGFASQADASGAITDWTRTTAAPFADQDVVRLTEAADLAA